MPDGDTAAPPTVSGTTVTRAVLGAAADNAARYGDRRALADPEREIGYARFAASVPAAACGLRRHGVRPGDVGAVHVTGVCDLALAVHAVTAAGAVPAPLRAGAPVAELAAMMNECGARFLLVGAEGAPPAMAAAERSYVRQVFAFGDVPGATAFGRLMDGGSGEPFPVPPPDPLRDPALRLWGPSEEMSHADRLADLDRLAGVAGVGDGDVLAVCGRDVPMPTWIGLADLCLTQGALLVGVPGGGARALLDAILRHRATAAVVTPADLRAIAFDHDAVPVPGVRLLVTGAASAEAVRGCRDRHGWTVSPLR
ncbi:AMP-binding protein [Actinomadura graeca]|uniref:AMP-binding protein n=1 Tax=Actinomadura graeca TaxID=2750812 RepID=A0ABX8QPX7_9ACTN|nr:AMP-binding protein [Actinomadura graeca]QXJ20471.1 AMP-binding protein [Actinomadura graeca]